MTRKKAKELLPAPPRKPSERPGPVGGKRDKNRKRRIQELCQAAQALFLRQGTASVTIEQITSEAGVAKGSFYRYFKDKEELLSTLLAPLAEPMGTALLRCEERLRKATNPLELIDAYQTLGFELWPVLEALPETALFVLQEFRAPIDSGNEPVRALATQLTHSALALTQAAHQHGLLRPINPQVSGRAVLGAVERLLFDFLQGQLEGEPLELAADLVTMVLDGLLVRPDQA